METQPKYKVGDRVLALTTELPNIPATIVSICDKILFLDDNMYLIQYDDNNTFGYCYEPYLLPL